MPIFFSKRSISTTSKFGWSTLDGLAVDTESERYQFILIQRISIENTRNIINAIHENKINDKDLDTLPIFNLSYPKNIAGVDSSILNPANSWKNKEEFKETLQKVAEMFK
jgi:ATP-dependent phosphoenolpyruvate carboxykinase